MTGGFISFNFCFRFYNSLDEIAKEMVNEGQSGGKYTVRYSPEDFPSGMCTFKLEYTGNESTCKVLKMIH